MSSLLRSIRSLVRIFKGCIVLSTIIRKLQLIKHGSKYIHTMTDWEIEQSCKTLIRIWPSTVSCIIEVASRQIAFPFIPDLIPLALKQDKKKWVLQENETLPDVLIHELTIYFFKSCADPVKYLHEIIKDGSETFEVRYFILYALSFLSAEQKIPLIKEYLTLSELDHGLISFLSVVTAEMVVDINIKSKYLRQILIYCSSRRQFIVPQLFCQAKLLEFQNQKDYGIGRRLAEIAITCDDLRTRRWAARVLQDVISTIEAPIEVVHSILSQGDAFCVFHASSLLSVALENGTVSYANMCHLIKSSSITERRCALIAISLSRISLELLIKMPVFEYEKDFLFRSMVQKLREKFYLLRPGQGASTVAYSGINLRDRIG